MLVLAIRPSFLGRLEDILRTIHATPEQFGDLGTDISYRVAALSKSSPSGHFSTCMTMDIHGENTENLRATHIHPILVYWWQRGCTKFPHQLEASSLWPGPSVALLLGSNLNLDVARLTCLKGKQFPGQETCKSRWFSTMVLPWRTLPPSVLVFTVLEERPSVQNLESRKIVAYKVQTYWQVWEKFVWSACPQFWPPTQKIFVVHIASEIPGEHKDPLIERRWKIEANVVSRLRGTIFPLARLYQRSEAFRVRSPAADFSLVNISKASFLKHATCFQPQRRCQEIENNEDMEKFYKPS